MRKAEIAQAEPRAIYALGYQNINKFKIGPGRNIPEKPPGIPVSQFCRINPGKLAENSVESC